MTMQAHSPPPWLSILLPAYNVEPYLAECLQSIASQWSTGVEVIVVEDCSTDGTAAELARLKREILPALNILHHSTNQGLSAARNTGLDAAAGEYIWFLDSDDMLAPGCIAQLKSIVDQHAPDLVLCDFRMLREKMRLKHRLRGELHRSTFHGPSDQLSRDKAALLNGVFHAGQMHSWSKISRKALWRSGLRFPVGRYFEDARTTPDLLLAAESFYHCAQPWVLYRQREGSILASMNARKLVDMFSAFDEFSGTLKRTHLWRQGDNLFGIEFHLIRTFVGACKHLYGMPPDRERAELFSMALAHLRSGMPYGIRSGFKGFLKRLWFNRATRLAFWLLYARRFNSTLS